MEYPLFLFAFVWCGFGFVADMTKGISIDNCDQNSLLDIRENSENNITCRDFDANAWVSWWIQRPDTSARVLLTTCTSFNCTDSTDLETDLFTVQRSQGESQLTYRQQNREEDFSAKIVCDSVVLDLSGQKNREVSCRLNVISPAILSDCLVEEDRNKGTVKGSCQFNHAFSTFKGFLCTWYRTSSSQIHEKHLIDIIRENYTSNGQVYWGGHCNLSLSGQHWNDGEYSYSIDFYPGPGRQSVPVQIFGPGVFTSSSVTSSQPGPSQSTASTTGTPEGPGVSSSSSVSVSPPGPNQSTASATENLKGLSNDPDKDDDSLPIAAIAGGAAAAVVVIIVVVVIVLVVIRRRQRRKPAETPKTSRDNDYWEEHINTAYVSCGHYDDDNDDHDASLDHHQRPTPTTTSTNTSNDDDTRAASRLYASADGDYEDADLPGISYPLTEDGYDGYSAVGPTRRQAREVPDGDDDYTVVDDFRTRSGPNRDGTGPGSKPITDTYAVVDKSKKRTGPNKNGTAPVTETYAAVDKSRKRTGPNRNGTAPVTETYAVVDKSRKRNAPPRNERVQNSAADDYSQAEPEGDPYSHLQLSSAPVKPVPPKKPTMKAEVTQSAASDDVYNKLNFD